MQFPQLSGAAAPTFSANDKLAGKLAFSGPKAELNQNLEGQKRSANVAEPGISGSERRQTALQIFERTLSMGYQKLSGSYQRASSPAAFEPLSAEKVAANILGFIEHRLRQDVAQGATQEQLQSRLEAGLSGFNKGFAEAKEKLEALSLLSPVVEQDIGQTQDLVLSGIEALREKLISNSFEAKAPIAQNSEPAKSDQSARVPSSGHYEYARASEFRFSLQTAEGDRLTISARGSFALASDFETQGSNFELTASGSSVQRFAISVDGDLNDEERGAIVELLGKVDKLASQFFAGDLDKAFAQAQNLGYDSRQIAAFSLNLSQVEVRRASQTYQQVAGSVPDQASTRLQDGLQPLSEFLQTLSSALQTASKLAAQPEDLLVDLSARLVRPEPAADFNAGRRFQEFVEKILATRR